MTLPSAVQRLVESLSIEDGPTLAPPDRALIALGLAASVTSLNKQAVEQAIRAAFEVGNTPAQVQEVISLVSGLGVHSLMLSAATVLDLARKAGHEMDAPLSISAQQKWEQRVGTDPFWAEMEQELPGFLRSLLRLSPEQFDAFFEYCAVPWKGRSVNRRTKELLAMACDALPAHVFMPGLRLHLNQAIKAGAGLRAIKECLALAAAAPAHVPVE